MKGGSILEAIFPSLFNIPRMMKTAFNTNSGFTGPVMPDIEEIAQILSRAGLDGIELNAEIFFGSKNRHAGMDISDEEIKRIGEVCNRYNLGISSIGAHFPFTSIDGRVREKNLKEYKRCIDQAVILNVDFVHGYSGGIKGPISEEDSKELWNIFKSGLLETLDYAKEKGVKFGIEAVIHHLVHGYKSIKRMFEFTDRDDLYLNYDPCHLFLSKPEGGHIKVLEEFGEKVEHVHVHDAVGIATFDWQRYKEDFQADWSGMRPFGLGEIDWKEVVKNLKGKGFDGYLSFEFGIAGGYVPGYRYYTEIVARAYNEKMKELIKNG